LPETSALLPIEMNCVRPMPWSAATLDRHTEGPERHADTLLRGWARGRVERVGSVLITPAVGPIMRIPAARTRRGARAQGAPSRRLAVARGDDHQPAHLS
jgi:hypothetical protein